MCDLRRLTSLAWPFLVLLTEVIVFYRRILFSGHFVIPWDFRYYHFSQAAFVAKSFARGELPLWDPYTYCGVPLYANIQAQVFYPPTVLTILLSNWTGGRNLLYFLEVQLIGHIILAGIGTYLLLRKLNAGQTAALMAATVFQLGGFFSSQTEHLGAMESAAWLPFAWLSTINLAERVQCRWIAVLAFSLGMSILAGFPAVVAVVLISSVYLAIILILVRHASLVVLASVVLAYIWAALLAAVQLLPTMELTRWSVASLRSHAMGTGGGLPLQSLISLIAPNYYGILDPDPKLSSLPAEITYLYLYCGIPALVFGMAAVLLRRNRYSAVFAIVTLISALWMLGDSTPIGRTIFSLLPDNVRGPLYAQFAMLSFVLGVAVLAGLGADLFLRSRGLATRITLVVLTAVDLIATGSGRPMNTADTRREPGIAYEQLEGFPILPERLRQLVNQTVPPARIDTAKASPNWAQGAPLLEIPSANGCDPFALQRFMQVRLSFCQGQPWGRYYEIDALDSPVLDLLNVRFVLTRNPIAPEILNLTKLTKLEELPGNIVYENSNVLPRFFLVHQVRRVADAQQAITALRAPDFDPRIEALVEGPVSVLNADAARRINVLEYAPHQVILEVETATPAYLVTSEAHYPGWRAFIDGHEHPLYFTDAAFRGLAVPAGKHKVSMRFEPMILWRAALISIAAWLLLIAAPLGEPGRLRRRLVMARPSCG